MKTTFALALLLAGALAGSAQLKTETVEYRLRDLTFEGHLVYDDAVKGPRPAVLIVHQWKGLTAFEKKRAEMIAQLGYTAFAVDIYGKGVRPQTVAEAGAESGKYKADRALLRERVNSGLSALLRTKVADPGKVVAIGYCFGGMTVLELARGGAEVAGVVSFHGSLDSPKPEDAQNIKDPVLVLHGADDPFVPDADVAAFEKEMRDAKVDWRLIKYGGAVHSFTDWDADKLNIPGAKYDAKADQRSWEDLKLFLAEAFK